MGCVSFCPSSSPKMVTFSEACKLLQKGRAGQARALGSRWSHLKETAASFIHMWEQQCPCFIRNWVVIARIRANSQNIGGFSHCPVQLISQLPQFEVDNLYYFWWIKANAVRTPKGCFYLLYLKKCTYVSFLVCCQSINVKALTYGCGVFCCL